MLLAGIRRDTGLFLEPSQFASYDLRRYLAKYLLYGESAYEYFVGALKFSGYFKLQRFNNLKRFVNDVNDTLNTGDKIRPLNEEESYTDIGDGNLR